MSVLRENHGILYQPLTPANFDKACHCVAETFTTSEPLTVALNITLEEHLAFARLFLRKAMEEGLSIVAQDAETREVVGVRISEDFATPDPEGADQLTPKMDPIFTLLDGLDERYREAHDITAGQYVHMFMIGVKSSYRNKNVAPTMNEIAFEIWKEKGYRRCITEATGVISQHILRDKFGFREIYRVDYDSFLFEEKHVFADLAPHTSCMLMVQELAHLGV